MTSSSRTTRPAAMRLKAGAEYIYNNTWLFSCRVCVGQIDAQGGPVPANIEQILPVWDDPNTWNLAALSSITRTYQVGRRRFHVLRAAAHLCRLGAGRLDDRVSSDGEPRPALRPVGGRVCRRDRVPAVLERESQLRLEQLGAAARLCLQPERPDGRARRRRHLLRRQLRAGRSRNTRLDADRQPADRQRRPARTLRPIRSTAPCRRSTRPWPAPVTSTTGRAARG